MNRARVKGHAYRKCSYTKENCFYDFAKIVDLYRHVQSNNAFKVCVKIQNCLRRLAKAGTFDYDTIKETVSSTCLQSKYSI